MSGVSSVSALAVNAMSQARVGQLALGVVLAPLFVVLEEALATRGHVKDDATESRSRGFPVLVT